MEEDNDLSPSSPDQQSDHEVSEGKRRKVEETEEFKLESQQPAGSIVSDAQSDEEHVELLSPVGDAPTLDTDDGFSGDDFRDTELLVGKKLDAPLNKKHLPPVLSRCVCLTVPIVAVLMVIVFCIIAGLLTALNPSCPLFRDLSWWKATVVYQIYPQSFRDTTGNGFGDLTGITQKLDYLQDLGVTTIWLNPIYQSPMADSGYDVASYFEINPLYGTMDDFKQLIKSAHEKGIKLLMDFVPNHTSDKHAWFEESRSNKSNPKRDWYVWAKPKNDAGTEEPLPPNNWVSVFGGSMWEYDSTTQEFYLHQFAKQQPDLNFRNPKVLDALDQALRFWLDLGVDGFRVDAIAHLFEDPQLRDEEMYPDQPKNEYNSYRHNYTKDYPEIHDVVRRWRKLFDSYGDRLMIGEIYSNTENVMTFFGSEQEPEFSFPFNFFLLENSNWTGVSVAEIVSTWLDHQPEFGWPNWVLGNHDNPRIASKAGPERARLLNVLLLLLPGTPTSYYGEELGMEDTPVPQNLSRDTNTDRPRDPERTPMQWNTSVNAGFTAPGVTPWLPLPSQDVVEQYNVETQRADPKSSLNLYITLVKLRSNAEFVHGLYKQIGEATEQTLVFLRYYKEGLRKTPFRYLVAINFSGNSTTVSASVEDFVQSGQRVLSSYMDHSVPPTQVQTASILLRPYEAVVVKGESDKWI